MCQFPMLAARRQVVVNAGRGHCRHPADTIPHTGAKVRAVDLRIGVRGAEFSAMGATPNRDRAI